MSLAIAIASWALLWTVFWIADSIAQLKADLSRTKPRERNSTK